MSDFLEQIERERCTCPTLGFSRDCPWARTFGDADPIGHVKACPVSGNPCPCLPGSTSQAYCERDAARLGEIDTRIDTNARPDDAAPFTSSQPTTPTGKQSS